MRRTAYAGATHTGAANRGSGDGGSQADHCSDNRPGRNDCANDRPGDDRADHSSRDDCSNLRAKTDHRTDDCGSRDLCLECSK